LKRIVQYVRKNLQQEKDIQEKKLHVLILVPIHIFVVVKITPTGKIILKIITEKTAFHYKEHKCNHCGWNEVPGVLVTHHIDRNRSNGNIDNLEILCPTCHMVEHFNDNDGPFKRSKD
jgi:5-methylcytosine-specific restriction endonuclease McrA